jgi:hypothetical protein
MEEVQKDTAVTPREVIYKVINDVCSAPIASDDLPFLKRYPYGDEREFRLLYVSRDEATEFHKIPLSLAIISRITLSPWMPAPLAEAVKDTLKQLDGCKTIKIYQSTLVENERWKKAAEPNLNTEGT